MGHNNKIARQICRRILKHKKFADQVRSPCRLRELLPPSKPPPHIFQIREALKLQSTNSGRCNRVCEVVCSDNRWLLRRSVRSPNVCRHIPVSKKAMETFDHNRASKLPGYSKTSKTVRMSLTERTNFLREIKHTKHSSFRLILLFLSCRSILNLPPHRILHHPPPLHKRRINSPPLRIRRMIRHRNRTSHRHRARTMNRTRREEIFTLNSLA